MVEPENKPYCSITYPSNVSANSTITIISNPSIKSVLERSFDENEDSEISDGELDIEDFNVINRQSLTNKGRIIMK